LVVRIVLHVVQVAVGVASKRALSVRQPYRDLRKLLRKSSAVTDQAPWIFHGAPSVASACYLTVAAIVSVIIRTPRPSAFPADLIGGALVLTLGGVALSLAGFDPASPSEGLGACLYRPAVPAVEKLADVASPVQSGDVNLYLLYLFALYVVALYVVAAVLIGHVRGAL
jgi:hypothetical protein